MNDIGADFVKKLFGKKVKPYPEQNITIKTSGNLNRDLEPYEKLQREVDKEQSIVENKIKLKALKSITAEELDKAFKNLKIDEIITSTLSLKVAESVRKQSDAIVREALEDLEESFEIKRAIKTKVVNIIKNAFK
jgi:hypothetical protein